MRRTMMLLLGVAFDVSRHRKNEATRFIAIVVISIDDHSHFCAVLHAMFYCVTTDSISAAVSTEHEQEGQCYVWRHTEPQLRCAAAPWRARN
jgi:protein-disulfide isomerase